MAAALRKSTGCWLLRLRSDLDREEARAYWRGPHARLVARVPGVTEYRQLHFSALDRGFWPAPPGVGSSIPSDWRLDGMPEVAFSRALPSPASLAAAFKYVFPDESNAFERVLGHLSGPGGGRWFGEDRDDRTGARAVVLLRRRPGVRLPAFRSFVHAILGAALSATPETLELRTHAFLPYSPLLWPTPGVSHLNPPHRRYHGALVLGTADRAGLEAVLRSAQVEATRAEQARHCVALHAYAVEETVVVVRDGVPQLG